MVGAEDEDCLSLNVWAPAAGAAIGGRPMLVWLHGGGWAVGLSGSPVYDGAAVAAATGAVVVTINYRLGSLGWLNHSSLGANWGLQDMALAFAWVRANAAAFGGNRDAITAWGQSAGAGSVLHLLCSPLGEDLFTRAIAQSPPLGEVTVPRERGEAWAEALSAQLRDGPFDIESLRDMPAATIVNYHEALLGTPEFRGTRGGAMPVEDPATLPADPRKVAGSRAAIPVMIGTANDEATFLFRAGGRVLEPDDAQLQAIVAHLPDVTGPEQAVVEIEQERARGAGDNNDVLCRLATHHLFLLPVVEWTAARRRAGAEVFDYRVSFSSPDARLGATHTIDVPLVFGTYDTEKPTTPRSARASRAAGSARRRRQSG
jgi:para-nitrobenzyl esterase